MYTTLMAHFQLADDNGPLLRLTAGLAARFRAGVTGVVAVQPLPAGSGLVVTPDDVMRRDLARKRSALADLEMTFRVAMRGRSERVHWRTRISPEDPIDFVVRCGGAADLVITRIDLRRPLLDAARPVHTADLAIRLGRPVLAVPAGVDVVPLNSVLVGWKDTREARRAIADALPILKLATRVTVGVAVRDHDHGHIRGAVREVCDWLGTHDIDAQSLIVDRDDAATAGLAAIARDVDADLVVAGAYGHSRFREWVLGGVTRELLTGSGRCLLLSH